MWEAESKDAYKTYADQDKVRFFKLQFKKRKHTLNVALTGMQLNQEITFFSVANVLRSTCNYTNGSVENRETTRSWSLLMVLCKANDCQQFTQHGMI